MLVNLEILTFWTLTFLFLQKWHFDLHPQKFEFGACKNVFKSSWDHWFFGPFNHLVVVVQNKSYKKTLFRLTTKVSPLISWVSIFNIFPCRISSPIHACVRYAEHLENDHDKKHKEATVEEDFFQKRSISAHFRVILFLVKDFGLKFQGDISELWVHFIFRS